MLDMFDFNQDGNVDPGEFAMGMMIIEDIENNRELENFDINDNEDEIEKMSNE